MNPYYTAIKKYLLFFGLIAVCGRFIHESVLILFAIYGLFCGTKRKYGMTIACFIFMSYATMMNPGLIARRPGTLLLCAKLASLIMMIAMIIIGLQRRNERFHWPIMGLYFYLGVAIISSIGGWFPLISFLKIAQFALFLGALYCALIIMDNSSETFEEIRGAFMALAIITIVGSLLILPFPKLAYSMTIKKAGYYAIVGYSVVASGAMTMLNGVCYHSQALAPIASILTAWVLCDMLYVERKVSVLHMSILGVSPIILFLTRSRTAIISLLALFFVVLFYTMRYVAIPPLLKKRIKTIAVIVISLGVIAATILEIRSGIISKWIRKTDEVVIDERSTMEAVTETRMGLVERNMYDFSLNPLLGKGFQVMPEHKQWYRQGRISLLSAPIEKGVLPTMVLGETGIVGMVIFIIFLYDFIMVCSRLHYVCMIALFTVFVASNMGEASFFSPSGQGGVMWLVVALGGFCCDMLTIRAQQNDNTFRPPGNN